MKKVAFRFTSIAGAPIKTSWRDIEHLSGQTVGESDVIEYAYAAPVVTFEMAYRMRDALDALGVEITSDACTIGLTAALDPDNAD